MSEPNVRSADAGMDARALATARALCPRAFTTTPAERVLAVMIWGVPAAFTLYALWLFDCSPLRILAGLGRLAEVLLHMIPPTANDALWDYLAAMVQTVAMAFLGTVIAAVLALPLGLACARNIVPVRVLQLLSRRSSDMLRGVDQMIWALIFVRAVGLGPLAGILAIVISDIGTLAKLYSEAIENVDRRPIDGMRASGADTLQTVRFGILPQVLPVMLSNVLYIFESNTRSATILGIVGAGGIGFYLSDRIRTLQWEEASFILLLILITVYLIDAISRRIRAALIGGGAAPAPAADNIVAPDSNPPRSHHA